MSQVKKYFLIDPLKYDSLVANRETLKSSNSSVEMENVFTHPNVKAVNKLDDEMKSILEDSKLTDFEKVEAYNSKLGSYLRNFKQAMSVPSHEALLGKQDKDIETNNDASFSYSKPELSLEQVMGTVPSSYKIKASKLLNFLKENSSFSWDENGQLKYKDDVLLNSDLSKLINDIVRNKKISSVPQVFDKFVNILVSEGYPVKQNSFNLPVKHKSLIPLPQNKGVTKKLSRHSAVRRRQSSTARNNLSHANTNILKNWRSV